MASMLNDTHKGGQTEIVVTLSTPVGKNRGNCQELSTPKISLQYQYNFKQTGGENGDSHHFSEGRSTSHEILKSVTL